MAEKDTYKLLEFQPKTCYLPSDQPGTGTLRRSSSANGRIQDSRATREADFEARSVVTRNLRRSPSPDAIMHMEQRRGGYASDYRGHEMESYKQPLMPQPLFVLMPAQAAGGAMDYYQGRGAPLVSTNSREPLYMDTLARRRMHSHRDMEYDDSYRRRKKSCCSCWRCAIAAVIILAILGVGTAITAIVFIKLSSGNIEASTVAPIVNRNQSTSTEEPSRLNFDIAILDNSMDTSDSTIVRDGSENSTSAGAEIGVTNSPTIDIPAGGTVVVTNGSASAPATSIIEDTQSSEVVLSSAPQFDVDSQQQSTLTPAVIVSIQLPPNDTDTSVSVSHLSASGLPVNASLVPVVAEESTSSPVELTTGLVATVQPPAGFLASVRAAKMTSTVSSTSNDVSTLHTVPVMSESNLEEISMPSTPAPGVGFMVTGMSIETSSRPPMRTGDSQKNAMDAIAISESLRMPNTRLDAMSHTNVAPSTDHPLIQVNIMEATTSASVAGVNSSFTARPEVEEVNASTEGANSSNETTTIAYIGAKIFHRKPT